MKSYKGISASGAVHGISRPDEARRHRAETAFGRSAKAKIKLTH
jgi:hypothetical protein